MKKLGLTSLIASAALLSACANETPLMFVSKTSVGLDVSSPTTGSTEVGISFGWKSIDAAYVPVVEIIDDSTNTQLYQISSGESLTAEEKAKTASNLATLLTTSTASLTQTSDAYTKLLANPAATGESKKQKKTEVDSAQDLVSKLSEALIKSVDRSDALSVFSVVDTNTMIRSSDTSVGVGKIFATGMAAQNVSRDFNSSRGCVTAISNAVAKLAASTETADQAKAKALVEACK